MSSGFTLAVETRTELGKGASRRLRREKSQVLGIIYGSKQDPVPVFFANKHIVKLIEHEAFFTSLITLTLDGTKEETVVAKDMQRHPATNNVLHVDFMRISKTTKITMQVPLHFVNADTCPGVKLQGGVASYAVNDIEISCLPADLPEFITVDMGQLNLGDSIHLSNLELPNGVDSVALSHGADYDLLVVAINAPRGGAAAGDEVAAEAAAGEAGAENGKE